MNSKYSLFGRKIAGETGIQELMDDLGKALANKKKSTCMLGGGNPAHIPEVAAAWEKQVANLSADSQKLAAILGNYDSPQGNPAFLKTLARFFNEQFGWDLSEKNLAITSGGQAAFFLIFNLLAGKMSDGKTKKILVPLVPEYIGYADLSVCGEMFRANRPKIEILGRHEFKYKVDFESLEIENDVAAICVSRPTNPTGNVLSDEEIEKLIQLSEAKRIPLIIDNAYGAPFPNIIFTEARPIWSKNIILTLSLSKIGLPGTRTGIVIADENIIRSVAAAVAVTGLSNNNIGQAIIQPFIESSEILRISNDIVRPYYEAKSQFAQNCWHEFMDNDLPWFIHKSEGALFLWMWFKDLPISSKELYQRLKARDVLVVPGEYFFFGEEGNAWHDLAPDGKTQIPWKHQKECFRMSFAADEDVVRRGISIIAEEVKNAYAGN